MFIIMTYYPGQQAILLEEKRKNKLFFLLLYTLYLPSLTCYAWVSCLQTEYIDVTRQGQFQFLTLDSQIQMNCCLKTVWLSG